MTLRLTKVAFAIAFLSSVAAAQTPAIDAARASGQIGERFDGYIGFASAPNAMVRSQAGAINIKRRSLYSNLAAQKGATLQDVGITAGCTLLARVPVGGSYMLADGKWRKRGAGEPAPVPDYCR